MSQRARLVNRVGRWCGVLLGALALSGSLACGRAAAATGFDQFQVNAGLTGSVYGAGVLPPLTKTFTYTTGFQNSYIPIDGGRAYAFGFPGGTYGGSTSLRLDAVTLTSGKLAWSQTLDEVDSTSNMMLVDGGRVFAAVSGEQAGTAVGDIVLSALNESTGAVLWRDTLPQQTFPNSLVASGGVLYLDGDGDGGTVYAINESSGTVRWADGTSDGNPLTLAGGILVLAGSGSWSCGLNAQTGGLVWARSSPDCSGGGQGLASYDGTRVWGEDPGSGNEGYVYNPSSGAVVSRFPGYAPAFGDGEAVHDVTSSSGTLEVQAFNPKSTSPLWTFAEPKASTDPMGSMPLLADGYVFAEGSHATVWALNACTGKSVWSGSAGSDAPYEGFDPLPGLSAGDGYLVAPTQIKFTAFRGSGTPSGSAPVCAG